jgi:predicted GNAT family acetyltransferase
MNDTTGTVRDNPAENRYELTVDGYLAAAYYKLSDGVITFVHTEVPKELGGRGIGSQLVKGALDDVRARNLKVVAQCPFVAGYIGKHADYSGLLK